MAPKTNDSHHTKSLSQPSLRQTSRSQLFVGLIAASVAWACSPSTSLKTAASPTQTQSNEIQRFFPLREKTTFIYDRINEQTGHRENMLVIVTRVGPNEARFQTPSSVRNLVFTDHSVGRKSGRGMLLVSPLRRGSSWVGDNGGNVLVEDTSASVEVPAGRFTGCVRTVERVGATQSATVTSVYCPNVGLTFMKVEEWVEAHHSSERMELRSVSSNAPRSN